MSTPIPAEIQKEMGSIIATGQFIDSIVPVLEGETIIGEMLPEEKALYTLLQQLDNAQAKICHECRQKYPQSEPGRDSQCQHRERLLTDTVSQWRAIQSIMDTLIEKRLNTTEMLGVRQGFKLVMFSQPWQPVLTGCVVLNEFLEKLAEPYHLGPRDPNPTKVELFLKKQVEKIRELDLAMKLLPVMSEFPALFMTKRKMKPKK